jgi:hypothetical protein
MTNRPLTLIVAIILLAATPLILSLPVLAPDIDGLFPFLAGVASFYLGLQLYCGELSNT